MKAEYWQLGICSLLVGLLVAAMVNMEPGQKEIVIETRLDTQLTKEAGQYVMSEFIRHGYEMRVSKQTPSCLFFDKGKTGFEVCLSEKAVQVKHSFRDGLLLEPIGKQLKGATPEGHTRVALLKEFQAFVIKKLGEAAMKVNQTEILQ